MLGFKRGSEVELEIHDFAFGGKGISRIQTEEGNYIVFVLNAIPGQKVRAKITKKRKKHAEGRLLEVIERSDLEQDVDFQPISGAPYISLPIDLQQKFKRDSVFSLFTKIA